MYFTETSLRIYFIFCWFVELSNNNFISITVN